MPKPFSGVLKEWGSGQLHSGAGGPVVPKTPRGQKQAVAIAYSEQSKLSKRRKTGRGPIVPGVSTLGAIYKPHK